MRSDSTLTHARTAESWRLHWLTRDLTIARYQVPVPLARVLGEHHTALAAEPLTTMTHTEEN